MKVAVVTKNKAKRAIVDFVFPKYGITYIFIDKDYPEIQAETSKEIAEFTAQVAAKDLKMPVVREDSSLYIKSLNFPGPFTSYMEKLIPVERLLTLLEGAKDRSGYFESAVTYTDGKGDLKTFLIKVDVEIGTEPRGNLAPKGAWDRVIMFKGDKRTFAEYSVEERLPVWKQIYIPVAEYISTKK